jgi:hypothetical protein
MLMSRKLCAFWACVAASLWIGGCGPGNPLGRQPISGEVLLDGAPLAKGAIRFEPQAGGPDAKGALVGAGAVIEAGKYSIPAHEGLPAGSYLVSITSTETTGGSGPTIGQAPEEAMKAAAETQFVEKIPAKYNATTELRADVAAGKPNVFDFRLESEKQ